MDLEALRSGQPPLQAHKRFDVSMLEKLEEGEVVESDEASYNEELVTKYRLAVLILGAVTAVSVLVIFLMLLL